MTDFSNLLEGVVLQDETQIQAGGQRLENIPEGKHPARLVGFVNTGHRMEPGFQGGPARKVNEVFILFEMLGKKVPRIVKDGVEQPRIEAFRINRSFSDKSNYPKMVSRLAFTGENNIFSMAVKRVPVMLTIRHEQGKDKTKPPFMSFKDEGGILAVSAPVKVIYDDEDQPAGEVPLKLPEAQHDPVVYQYEHTSEAMINTLDLKHWYMDALVRAEEFPGSRLEAELKSRGIAPETLIRTKKQGTASEATETPVDQKDLAEQIAEAVEKVNQPKNPLPKVPAKTLDPAPEVADLDDQDFE